MQTTRSAGLPAACRRMTWWITLTTLIGVIVYSVILAPLYNQLSVDVMYADSPWVTVIYLLREIVEPIVFFLVYPAIFYALWRGRWRGARGGLIAFGTLTLLKYIANFVATCIVDGALPGWDVFTQVDLPIILPTVFLELLQHALVVLIAAWVMHAYRAVHPSAGEGVAADAFLNARREVYPFARLLSWKNPLQRGVLLTSVSILCGRLVNHLMYQLTLIAYNGAPDEWLVVLIDIVSDVVIAVGGYLVMILLLSSFDRRELLRLGMQDK